MTQRACTDVKTGIRDYWHRRSGIYDKRHLSTRSEEETLAFKAVLEKVLKREKLKILDVGTGTGFLVLLLAEMGHEVTGLDLTESMLERAKNRARESALSIRFELGDAECLPFEDESFDAVVCRWVLWTLPNQLKALKEWRRVTKRGGQILVADGKWRDRSLTGRLKKLSMWLGVLVHERTNPWRYGYKKEINTMLPTPDGITPEEAIHLFEQAGLGNISVQMLDEIRDIYRRNAPLLCKLVYSYPMFLIKGERLEG